MKPLSSGDKAKDKALVAELATRIAEQQEMLFAAGKHKALVVLQGIDNSGKDGTVKDVFNVINPQGAEQY